ncbi:Morn repeat domain containing protein [Pandoravirus salinus]|uniref:Morn repeat domain containing protein n=1 Tax=Pandoravirus salinus TaxID=1349410 RepID=S4W2S1_9VIRU|nr:morn repeat domain [Pandoravirus salinus]AGO84852.1 Morn repeat domain containing protein [Pandoravirus salinus]
MECEYEAPRSDPDFPFDRLSDEVVLYILRETDARTLGAWALTSRRHRRLALDDSIWRHLCEAHFGPSPFEPPLPDHVDWRWRYRVQYHRARPTGADVGTVQRKGGYYTFWGDVLDGQPHGFGIEIKCMCPASVRIDVERSLSLLERLDACVGRVQGNWLRGKLDGAAIETLIDGSKMERCWHRGRSDSHGTLTYPSGARYQGAFWHTEPHGRGTLTLRGGASIDREWHRADSIETFSSGHARVYFAGEQVPRVGIYMWPDGSRYDGEFERGKSHGYGTVVHASGTIYEGEWRDDKEHGHGTVIYRDGNRYEGNWAYGMRDGYGTFTWASGQVYKGHSIGATHGTGAMSFADGDVYEGSYSEGRRWGRGTMSYTDGSRLSAIWDDTACADARVVLHRAGTGSCSPGSDPCRACVALAAGHSK